LKTSDEFFASLTEHNQAVKEKGVEEGEEKKAREVAKGMIKKGQPLKEICEITELNLEVIEKLASEI
jgi:predicted transposase YdaD